MVPRSAAKKSKLVSLRRILDLSYNAEISAMIEKILNAYRKDGDRRQELQDSIDERIKAKRQRFNEMIKKREERQVRSIASMGFLDYKILFI